MVSVVLLSNSLPAVDFANAEPNVIDTAENLNARVRGLIAKQ